MDELPEFNRNVLEVMRQPMEERKITISRAKMSVEFPGVFILLAAMNPCPCGFYNLPQQQCNCQPRAVFKYLNKISAPLLDRIDLHMDVFSSLMRNYRGAPAGRVLLVIRGRVIAARKEQIRRYSAYRTLHQGQALIHCNAQIGSRLLQEVCVIDSEGENCCVRPWPIFIFRRGRTKGYARSPGRSPIWPEAMPSDPNIWRKPFNIAVWTGMVGEGNWPCPHPFFISLTA